jgi:hypothetical protein
MPRMSEAEYQAYMAHFRARRKAIVAPQDAPGPLNEPFKGSEAELHKLVIQWLEMKGVRAIIHSRMDEPTSQRVGTIDLHFCVNVEGRGVPVAIELKVDGKQPKPKQREWMEDCVMDGWITGCAWSLDDVISIYNKALMKGKI